MLNSLDASASEIDITWLTGLYTFQGNFDLSSLNNNVKILFLSADPSLVILGGRGKIRLPGSSTLKVQNITFSGVTLSVSGLDLYNCRFINTIKSDFLIFQV